MDGGGQHRGQSSSERKARDGGWSARGAGTIPGRSGPVRGFFMEVPVILNAPAVNYDRNGRVTLASAENVVIRYTTDGTGTRSAVRHVQESFLSPCRGDGESGGRISQAENLP